MRLAIAAFALGIAIPLSSRAATFQVGPGKPYANLQAVAGLLNPGDRVEVDGNATYMGDVVFTRPGTPEALGRLTMAEFENYKRLSAESGIRME